MLCQGQATDIMIHAEEILKLKRVINQLYVKHTGQNFDDIGKTIDVPC
jgi:ATP-dependent Clp protease, protease subunit